MTSSGRRKLVLEQIETEFGYSEAPSYIVLDNLFHHYSFGALPIKRSPKKGSSIFRNVRILEYYPKRNIKHLAKK